jgi:predicted acylesterase/phospholipase RssA
LNGWDRMRKEAFFKSVVMAGGGCRCIWQAGFWHVASHPLGLDKAVIGCVSAGAAMACMVKSERIMEGVAIFKENFRKNRKNAYFSNLATTEPVFPQYAMYRKGLLAALDDAAMQKINRSPGIRVLIAKPPRSWNAQMATLLGIGAYTLEKHLLKPMHPVWSQKLGFRPIVVAAEKCETADQLADVVLQSSCTPPFVPVLLRNGHPVLDGGLIDNVPAAAVKGVQGPMLVLLSRRYSQDRIPAIEGRLYVQPSEPPFIGRWDYTNPQGLQKTFDLGCRDAEVFLKKVEDGGVDRCTP